ncbi:hypothetical protein Ct61P_15147 [Colletotrichum tofieldiae]|nr:hypothetical protein Ct61P_15147 [Colletotrichum tofieldiae]
MIGCYLDTVVNRSAFAKLGTPPTVKVALDGNSTSTWNRHQLHACRVLVAANAESLLPVIGSNQQADKNGNRISKDMSDPFWEDYPKHAMFSAVSSTV